MQVLSYFPKLVFLKTGILKTSFIRYSRTCCFHGCFGVLLVWLYWSVNVKVFMSFAGEHIFCLHMMHFLTDLSKDLNMLSDIANRWDSSFVKNQICEITCSY